MKNVLLIALTLVSAGKAHAGILDWYQDRGYIVHKLAIGERRKISDTTVECKAGLDFLGELEEGVFYMAASDEPIRDRIEGVSLYCGRESDGHKYEDNLRKQRLLKQNLCIVKVYQDSSQYAADVKLLFYDFNEKSYKGYKSFGASQVQAANESCNNFEEKGQCTCQPFNEAQP